MSPFGAWFMVSEQFHYITNHEETFDFSNKKCRIYAVCGVLQTPKDGIDMIPDLRYRFTMKVVRLIDTMCLVQDY